MFRNAHEEYLVPGIEEDKIPTSELEEKMPVHVIFGNFPDGYVRGRPLPLFPLIRSQAHQEFAMGELYLAHVYV